MARRRREKNSKDFSGLSFSQGVPERCVLMLAAIPAAIQDESNVRELAIIGQLR